jgi:hypothetical protein
MSQTIKERLTEAWEIATRFPGDAYVVAAHAFVCHSDGSDCDATSISISAGAIGPGVPALKRVGCVPDRENLHMLDAAGHLHGMNLSATLDDLVKLWAQHMVLAS